MRLKSSRLCCIPVWLLRTSARERAPLGFHYPPLPGGCAKFELLRSRVLQPKSRSKQEKVSSTAVLAANPGARQKAAHAQTSKAAWDSSGRGSLAADVLISGIIQRGFCGGAGGLPCFGKHTSKGERDNCGQFALLVISLIFSRKIRMSQ